MYVYSYTDIQTGTVGAANIQWAEGHVAPAIRTASGFSTRRSSSSLATPVSPALLSATARPGDPSMRRTSAAKPVGERWSILGSNTPTFQDLYCKDNATDSGASLSTGCSGSRQTYGYEIATTTAPTTKDRFANKHELDHSRVRNKSALAYDNVMVNVYLGNFNSLTPGTEFFYPVDWNPQGLIGSATVNVPAKVGAAEGSVIAKIEWPAALIPPAAGWHPCLLGEILPMEKDLTNLHHVWENRKLCQRNLTIIDPEDFDLPSNLHSAVFYYDFIVGHSLRGSLPTNLEIEVLKTSKNVRLFVDTGGRVPVLPQLASVLVSNISIPLPRKKGRLQGFAQKIKIELKNKLPTKTMLKRLGLVGCIPVIFNDHHLLEIMPVERASFPLNPKMQSGTLRIWGVFSTPPSKREKIILRIQEAVKNKRVLGGVTLEVRW